MHGYGLRRVTLCHRRLIVEHERMSGEGRLFEEEWRRFGHTWGVVEEARGRGTVCDMIWVDLRCLGVGVSVNLFGVVMGADEREDGDEGKGADDAAGDGTSTDARGGGREFARGGDDSHIEAVVRGGRGYCRQDGR